MLTFRQRLSLAWRILRKEKSNLLQHAESELLRYFPPDPQPDPFDYDPMPGWNDEMRTCVSEIVHVFSTQGHSGGSAPFAIGAAARLMEWKPLGPLTGEPDEWCFHDYGENAMWQNKRFSAVFKDSEDGPAYWSEGRVFEEPDGARYTGSGSRVEITFPWAPGDPEIVKVDADGNPLPPETLVPFIEAMKGATLQRGPDFEGGVVSVHFSDPNDSWPLFRLLQAGLIAGQKA